MRITNLKPLISEEAIQTRVKEMAGEISTLYKDEPLVVVCVLKGAFMFFSDPSYFLYQNTSASSVRTRLAKKPIPALTSPCNGRDKKSGTPIHDENPAPQYLFPRSPVSALPHYKSLRRERGGVWGGERDPF